MVIDNYCVILENDGRVTVFRAGSVMEAQPLPWELFSAIWANHLGTPQKDDPLPRVMAIGRYPSGRMCPLKEPPEGLREVLRLLNSTNPTCALCKRRLARRNGVASGREHFLLCETEGCKLKGKAQPLQ